MIESITYVVAIFAGCIGGYGIVRFIDYMVESKGIDSNQIKIIIKWLIYACSKAESRYGSKTGELKLAAVYDDFISKFPMSWVKKVSFSQFSTYVDCALAVITQTMQNNPEIKEAIKNID